MKLITLLSAISLLTACQGKPNHDFTIKGNIKGYTGDIQLKKMLPIEERDYLVAKTTVNKEGDFSFTI